MPALVRERIAASHRGHGLEKVECMPIGPKPAETIIDNRLGYVLETSRCRHGID